MTCVVLSSDPSVTPHNVIPVFQALTEDWDQIDIYTDIYSDIYTDIGRYTIVPPPRAQLLRDKLTTRDELTETAGEYFALYHPDPAWKWLSVELYRRGEMEALEIARPHIQTVRGM